MLLQESRIFRQFWMIRLKFNPSLDPYAHTFVRATSFLRWARSSYSLESFESLASLTYRYFPSAWPACPSSSSRLFIVALALSSSVIVVFMSLLSFRSQLFIMVSRRSSHVPRNHARSLRVSAVSDSTSEKRSCLSALALLVVLSADSIRLRRTGLSKFHSP